MRPGEGLRHFLDLPRRLVRAEVDRRADRDRAHLERLLDAGEHDLVEAVRVGEELVVVQLHHERDLVGVLARHRAQRPERRDDAVAAALDGQLDDVGRVEIDRRRREARARRVLDALVDRQDRDVAGAAQAAGVEDRLEVAQHRGRPVGLRHDAIDEVGPGQVQVLLVEALRFVAQKGFGLGTQELVGLGGSCGRHVRRFLDIRRSIAHGRRRRAVPVRTVYRPPPGGR